MALAWDMASSPAAFAVAPMTRLRPSAVPPAFPHSSSLGDASHHHRGPNYTLAAGGGAALGLVGALVKSSLRRRVATQAAFNPSNSVGALLPLGYWDPVGLMKEREGMNGFRWKDETEFERYRIAELKHGRLAMVALTGMLSASLAKFPIFQTLPDVEGWAVKDTPAASGIGMFFIVAGYFETTTPKGDYNDPLGLGAYEGWGYTNEVKEKELAHGRLAMSAVATLWLYEYGAGALPSDLLERNISGLAVAALIGLTLIWSNPAENWTALAKDNTVKLSAASAAPEKSLPASANNTSSSSSAPAAEKGEDTEDSK